ncbi:hypothetical protein OROGR_025587 [Orobanche gracilis]
MDMKNRAVRTAARGGNWEILMQLVGISVDDILAYRDAQGCTVLHSASGRGQVEVVRKLLASFDIINLTDAQGNTTLHVTSYKGYLSVVEILIDSSPSLALLTNHQGNTLLHMAVAGFTSPGFRRLDKHAELLKQLIVELLMSVPSIDLNTCDADGFTPLDLLKQKPRSAWSDILIRQLIFAGGISNHPNDAMMARNTLSTDLHLKTSPGTSFRIPYAEIFLYTGIENASDANYESD